MKPPGHVQAVIDDLKAHGYPVCVRHMPLAGSLRYALSGGREMNAQQLVAHYDAIRKRMKPWKS